MPISPPDPRQQAADKAEALAKWREKPEVKLLVSLLPPLETDMQKECFGTLLQIAFDAGYNAGEGVILTSMLKAMMEDRRRPGDR